MPLPPKKMKLRIKTVVEITLDVDEDSYPAGSTPTKILNLEQKNLPTLLHSIIDDENATLENTLTLTEVSGVVIARKEWKEGPDEG